MGDRCGQKHEPVVRDQRPRPRRMATLTESLINQTTSRALGVLREIASMIHIDDVPKIGHIHAILDEGDRSRLLGLRTRFLELLGQVSAADKETHIRSALETMCGSVATFLRSGQLPDTTFDRFYVDLMALNGYFHEHGHDHTHRTPQEDEIPELDGLRARILPLLQELSGDSRVRLALERCCKPTLDFLQSRTVEVG